MVLHVQCSPTRLWFDMHVLAMSLVALCLTLVLSSPPPFFSHSRFPCLSRENRSSLSLHFTPNHFSVMHAIFVCCGSVYCVCFFPLSPFFSLLASFSFLHWLWEQVYFAKNYMCIFVPTAFAAVAVIPYFPAVPRSSRSCYCYSFILFASLRWPHMGYIATLLHKTCRIFPSSNCINAIHICDCCISNVFLRARVCVVYFILFAFFRRLGISFLRYGFIGGCVI